MAAPTTALEIMTGRLMEDGVGFVAIAARFFGAMTIFPILSAPYFSKLLKMSLACAFSLIIFPSLPVQTITQATYFCKLFYVFKEYLVGSMIGFVLAMPVWIITSVGQFLDSQRGESMGATMNPLSQSPTSSFGNLLVQSFVAYFVTMNGLVFFAGAVYKSFAVFPLDQFLPLVQLKTVESYIGLFKFMTMWIVLLALPVVMVMFFVEIVLGLLSTFLPQLNVTMLSMPIKSSLCLGVLVLYSGHLYQFTLSHVLEKIKGVYV